MKRSRKYLKLFLGATGWMLCAAAVLLAVAVVLAFFTERLDGLDASLSPREIAASGLALLLVAVFVLGREARRERRLGGLPATASLLCVAAGAVLIWSAFDPPQPGEDPGRVTAENPPGHGSDRKSKRGGGRLEPKPEKKKSHPHNSEDTPSSEDQPSEGAPSEGPEAGQSSTPPPGCDCPPPEKNVPEPPPPPADPKPIPDPDPEPYAPQEDGGEDGRGEDEGGGGEEDEDPGEEGWEEEEWEEEGW